MKVWASIYHVHVVGFESFNTFDNDKMDIIVKIKFDTTKMYRDVRKIGAKYFSIPLIYMYFIDASYAIVSMKSTEIFSKV